MLKQQKEDEMRIRALVLTAGLVLASAAFVFAEQLNRGEKLRERSKVNTKWEKKADKNKDGVIDAKEAGALKEALK